MSAKSGRIRNSGKVDDIISTLESKSTQDIINWIITNIDISSIVDCLKTISPDGYDEVISMYQNRNMGAIGRKYPVNTPVDYTNRLEYNKLMVEHSAKGTILIPLAVFDFDVFEVPKIEIDDSVEKMWNFVQGDDFKYGAEEEAKESIKALNNIMNDDNNKSKGVVGELIKGFQSAVLYTSYYRFKNGDEKLYGVGNTLYVSSLEEFMDECKLKSSNFRKYTEGRRFDPRSTLVDQNYVNFTTYLYFKFLEDKKKLRDIGIESLNLSYPDDLVNFRTFLPYITFNINSTYVERIFRDIKNETGAGKTITEHFLYKYTVNTGYGVGYYGRDENDVRHIYSDQYHKYIADTLFEGNNFKDKTTTCNISGTSCIPLAYNVVNNKFLVKKIGKDKQTEYKSMTFKSLKRECKCLTPEELQSLPLVQNADDITSVLNNFETDAPPYHTRFYGEFLPETFWGKDRSDLRTHNMTDFDPSILVGDTGASAKSAKFGSSSHTLTTSENTDQTLTSNPFKRRRRNRYINVPLEKIPTNISNEKFRELVSTFDRIDACVAKKLNNFGRRSSGKKSLSQMRKLSAMGNVYLLGANFGKTTKYLTLTFDPKTKKWEKSPKWRTSGGLVQRVNGGLNVSPTKTGNNNFKKLRDLQIPPKDFSKLHYQFKPLKPSSFGYVRKALEQINKENKGMQLYPLGKNAYLSGRHAGVSSTYSQQDSERLGLWKPRQRIPRKVSTAQFQFGATRPAGSCFGKSNDYGPIRNGYTGQYMQGIVSPKYGYRGTQGVYGGVTGVVGARALSDVSIRQGLIPLNKKRRSR